MIFTIRNKKQQHQKDKRYQTQAWKKYSYELRATNPICCIKGTIHDVVDLAVDHIIPITAGGSFWDTRNHQVISKVEHSKKTIREQRKGVKTEWELNDYGEKIPKQI